MLIKAQLMKKCLMKLPGNISLYFLKFILSLKNYARNFKVRICMANLEKLIMRMPDAKGNADQTPRNDENVDGKTCGNGKRSINNFNLDCVRKLKPFLILKIYENPFSRIY